MKKYIAALASVALLAMAPLGLGGYEISVLLMILFYVILALGLDLVTGYCGQFSFATGAFYGIGAYTAAIMNRDLGTSIWLHLPAGAIVAGSFGLILGIPALRLTGHFLAIVTIAFQTIMYLAISQWTSFTGGQVGLSLRGTDPLRIFGVELFELGTLKSYYWMTLAVTAFCALIAWRLVNSRLGREWMAIRDDETLACAVGLNTTFGKLTAFVAYAALAGVAGVATAHALRGVTPDDFTIWISATVVAMMVLGGRGTFVGPIIGATVLALLPEFLGRYAEYKMLIYGIVLVVGMTFVPEGIVGRLRRSMAP
ncbi:branched-chain amino acid ABC transporter permease [Bradyrhizobium yuanmingense]|uniref:branched-chain amino acid ABC transporter permease n=1 Tax=Bradyrhizobium yuanmingense TaxID=108015 RepID=UPI0023BA0FC3|nr:branched-chain amino acid ABC transporter permease [Bradyrhizobium yuanmingense]MDF0520117.1 branched-chain amino acid ABC transporter permease [Bradyrhizobium yuanmingense]